MFIAIEPVTDENRQTACGIQAAQGQEGFVETVRECLEEAEQVACWRPGLLRADGTAVGLAMYGLWEEEPPDGRVWLDRLLIDGRFQGRGIGTAGLSLLIRHIRSLYHRDALYLSVYPENRTAARLYERFGFRFNGERDIHGEHVMVLQGDPCAADEKANRGL